MNRPVQVYFNTVKNITLFLRLSGLRKYTLDCGRLVLECYETIDQRILERCQGKWLNASEPGAPS